MNVKNYFSVVLDGMAKGLFASLIIGVILEQFGVLTNFPTLIIMGKTAKLFMGPCIGIAVALKREAKPYTQISAAIAGAIGAGTIIFAQDMTISIVTGEPAGAFVSALFAVELGKYLEGRSKFDLLIIPAILIIAGTIVGMTISPVIVMILKQVGAFINAITILQPIPMGILLGLIVGVILTLPISSAALCISIGIDGLAAGAALAGCCAQMIGFAFMSFRENGVSGLISQGIGTSMIQVPNIIKNPKIWIPPCIASMVCGLLSTIVFKMETNSVGAGMGTSGLVGQITTLAYMKDVSIFSILILHFIIPAVISLAIGEYMRKKGMIKFGDLKLS